MLKVYNYDIVFQEFPDEITLALNISNCPHHCKGCHSAYLWKDEGVELTSDYLQQLIEQNPGITCVGIMGGDYDVSAVNSIARRVRNEYGLKVGWYSGNMYFDSAQVDFFDYIKIGPYVEERGGLNNPTTNQLLFKIEGTFVKTIRNITDRLQHTSVK